VDVVEEALGWEASGGVVKRQIPGEFAFLRTGKLR